MINIKNIKFALILTVLGLSSCSANSNSDLQMEVISQKEQTLAEIDQTPTTFQLSLEKDFAAWQRAGLFFRQYIPDAQLSINTAKLISNRGSNSKYIYEVRRRISPNGDSTYSVDCYRNHPSATLEAAERNAKNLARFISSGVLELTLLER